VRAMTLEDVDEVLAIEQAVQAYPWTRGNFIDVLSQGYVCRVDDDDGGVIRGYAVLRLVLDEAELLNIGVAALQQRKGLGRAMLRAMLDVAREKNIRRVFLEVRASNAAALALYRNTGFGEIGVRRGYYQNANGCEDAITMACELKQDASLLHAGARPGEMTHG
jgi:ribosomal-protein-alanine N-acetyltransferase